MLRSFLRATLGLLVAVASLPAYAGEADNHLREGAAHFRAGRFDEAVVEFKVARALGADDECPWYIAAALTRAGRTLEALEAFEVAQELAPKSADALFEFYRGVACADARLVVCASAAFEHASQSAGPKVAGQARKLAADARALLSAAPPRAAIDALLARSEEQARAGKPRLEKVFTREAAALSARREDHWREPEAKRLNPADAGAAAP